MGIKRSFIGISGSAGRGVDRALLERSHRAVRELSRLILQRGGGLVTTIGAEERLAPDNPSTARIFFWTILDEVSAFLGDAARAGSTPDGPLVRVVASQKAIASIPPERRELWDSLVDSRQIQLERLKVTWNAGAYVRQQQARAGDAIVLFGGGEGVEHLASLYVERGRPVIPVDAPLGAFGDDGSGGAQMLYRDACSHPERFVLDGGHAARLPTMLQGISLQSANANPLHVARRIADMLDDIVVFRAFFVRLLNDQVTEFIDVENFFSDVVTPCVRELGYVEDQVGLKPATEPFINREIFERLHHSDVVVADLTALRTNNFLELGYALGRRMRTMITAQEGTRLPFDTQAMPVHFWKAGQPSSDRKRLFLDSWRRYIDRPPVVAPRELG